MTVEGLQNLVPSVSSTYSTTTGVPILAIFDFIGYTHYNEMYMQDKKHEAQPVQGCKDRDIHHGNTRYIYRGKASARGH